MKHSFFLLLLLWSSLYSEDRIEMVYVLGSVNKPGSVEYKLISSQDQPEMILLLAEAGGFSKFAKQNGVSLIRGGTVIKTKDLTLSKLFVSGKKISPEEYDLKPGDIIFVPERGF
jgi:protein involved in polysaccharide export with SLBB domain